MGADETPLQYCPSVKGTYQIEGQQKQITIIAAREKRSATATPVVARDGTLVAFQIIWKGKTTQCHPRRMQHWDKRIFLDHAPKKMQTSRSFDRLLDFLSTRLKDYRRTVGLPDNFPCIVVVDNAPAHVLERADLGAPRTSEYLYPFRDVLWFFRVMVL